MWISLVRMFSAVRSQSYLRSQGFLRAYHQVQSSLNTLICARVSLRTGPLVEDGAKKESGKKKERTERTMGKGSDAPAPAPFPPRLRLLLGPFGRGQTLLAGACSQAMRAFALIAKIHPSRPWSSVSQLTYIYISDWEPEKKKENSGSKAAHCLSSINFYQCDGVKGLTVR